MGKVGKIIVYIVLVLVLIAGIGLIVKFTDGLTSDFKTFYVTVDGKDIMSTANDYTFECSSPFEIEVHYVFEKVTNDKKDYSVKIVPNKVEGEDFDFMINGEAYSFQAEKDLTSGFIITKGEGSFTVESKGELQDILKACYADKDIVVEGTPYYENMYTIIVTSYNQEATITINFSLSDGVQGITFDKETIIF